jgi:hypothetical protein
MATRDRESTPKRHLSVYSPRMQPQKKRPEKRHSRTKIVAAGAVVLSAIVTAAAGVLVPRFLNSLSSELANPLESTVITEFGTDYALDRSLVLPGTVSPRQLDELGSPLTLGTRPSSQPQAIKAYSQSLKITIQAPKAGSVTITNIRADIRDRAPAESGTLLLMPPEGTVENTAIGFDLASPDLNARSINNDVLEKDFFAGQSVILEPGQPQVFDVFATPGPFKYTWVLDVEFFFEEKRRHQTIQ